MARASRPRPPRRVERREYRESARGRKQAHPFEVRRHALKAGQRAARGAANHKGLRVILEFRETKFGIRPNCLVFVSCHLRRETRLKWARYL